MFDPALVSPVGIEAMRFGSIATKNSWVALPFMLMPRDSKRFSSTSTG